MQRRIALALSMLMASTPLLEAEARSLGFGKIFRAPGRVIGVVPGKVVILPHHSLRRTLGVVAAVGVVILSGLTGSQRAEVARRTRKAVESHPDEEVVDTYTTKKGDKTIKITASPSQPASTFRDDPALRTAENQGAQGAGTPAADTKRADGPQGEGTHDTVVTEAGSGGKDSSANTASLPEDGAKQAQKSADQDQPGVQIAALPEATPCRKVTTELTIAANTKSGEPEKTESNTAILCKTDDGKWQPAIL